MSIYRELYRIPNKKYSDGSPVVIDAAAIYKNTESNNIIAQLKITNISKETIIACKIQLNAYEIDKSTLVKEVIYSYLDLNTSFGQVIGSKIPIRLPSNTRYFDIVVLDVTFANNTTWSPTSSWEQIPKQSLLEEKIGNALAKEVNYLSKVNYTYYPRIYKNIFQCSCGTTNGINSSCSLCGLTYEDLIHLLDKDYLQECQNQRLLQEAIAKEKEEQLQKKRAQKDQKIANICFIIFCLCCISLVITGIFSFSKKELAEYKIQQGSNLIKVIENSSFNNYPSTWNEEPSYDGYCYTYHNHKFNNNTFDVDIYYSDEEENEIETVEFYNNSFSEESYDELLNDFIDAFGDDYVYSTNSGYDTNVNLFNEYSYTWSVNSDDDDGNYILLAYRDTGSILISRNYDAN